MLTAPSAHQLGNLLQLLMSNIELAELAFEKGEIEPARVHVVKVKDYLRTITDFMHAHTEPAKDACSAVHDQPGEPQ